MLFHSVIHEHLAQRRVKNKSLGTSSVTQWLRPCASKCRGHSLILVQGIKVPYDPWQSQKKKLGQIEKICIQFLPEIFHLGFVENLSFLMEFAQDENRPLLFLWPPCEALIQVRFL